MTADKLLERIGKEYPLHTVDPGEFGRLKVSGMHFTVTPYDADGLGRVCVMDVNGMLGLMKMQTVIVNPFAIDAPMLSCDRILAMGNETLYFEIYDTRLEAPFGETGLEAVKAKYADLPDKDPGAHWYDGMRLGCSVFKAGKKITSRVDALTLDYCAAYLAELRRAPACDPAEKREKAGQYSRGLIANGGPATDPFVKQFGKEKTAAFFRNVLFGAC